MKVITIGNQKGGVAKTTTAINISAGLALYEMSKNAQNPGRVLLVDMDPQGNAASIASTGLFHQFDSRVSKKSIANLLLDEDVPDPTDEIVNARIPTLYPISNLDFIPVEKSSLSGAITDLNNVEGGETRLAEGLSAYSSIYKWVVVDTGPSYNMLLRNSLTAADFIIVPVEISALGISSIEDMMGTITRTQKRVNPKLKILGILPARYNPNRPQQQSLLESMYKMYPSFTLSPIREREDISFATLEGMDVFSLKKPQSLKANSFKNDPGIQEFAQEWGVYHELDYFNFISKSTGAIDMGLLLLQVLAKVN